MTRKLPLLASEILAMSDEELQALMDDYTPTEKKVLAALPDHINPLIKEPYKIEWVGNGCRIDRHHAGTDYAVLSIFCDEDRVRVWFDSILRDAAGCMRAFTRNFEYGNPQFPASMVEAINNHITAFETTLGAPWAQSSK
jgi:hypothetical protein